MPGIAKLAAPMGNLGKMDSMKIYVVAMPEIEAKVVLDA